MTSATVYLNGARVASHDGGYLPWSVELTGGLNAGDNVIAVTVDGTWLDVPPDGNSPGAPSVDYLQPAGIYRGVTLQVTPQVFVADVFAKPTNVLATQPGVDVAVTIDAANVPSGPVTVHCTVLDGVRQVGSVDGQLTVAHTGTTTATLSITGLSGIALWSPISPKLYEVQATIVAGGVSHSATVRTGFRVAHFANDGFYLNGAKLPIFGLNRHQLFPYTGMAAPARLQRRDAELLRGELNCNMVRCSHYPPSPDFLDACDELGLMVWEEPPGWQYLGDSAFQTIVLQNVHDMVVRDRNRPSVIVWATRLNETANDQSLYAQALQLAYDLDGTRQTTGAMTNQNTSGWAEDVFAYDDYDSSSGNAFLKPPVLGVPYMVSESVGALAGAPLYRWVDPEATLAVQAPSCTPRSIRSPSRRPATRACWPGPGSITRRSTAATGSGTTSSGRGCWTPSASPSPGRRCIAPSSIRPRARSSSRSSSGTLVRSRPPAVRGRERCSPPTATGSSSTWAART